MLARQGQKIQSRLVMMRQPDHPVAVFSWPKTVFSLACRLTAFAPNTAFKVNHQRQL